MENKKNLKKMVSIVIIISFLFQMDIFIHSQEQEKDEIKERFQEAKKQYNSGQNANSQATIEMVIGTIDEKKGLTEQKKNILGQCYLLQGAISEKKGEPVAEEHYRRAIENYGIDTIDGVSLEELVIFKKVRLTIQVKKDFASAISDYNAGQYTAENYKLSIGKLNEIIQTLKANPVGSKDILGNAYLLLGAGYEKTGEIIDAEKNYREAFNKNRACEISGVGISDLPLYGKIKRVTGIEDQFEKAKVDFLIGLHPSSKKNIEEIIASIPGKESDPGLRKILGKCFLLLGAIYEKEGNPSLAEENYSKAKKEKITNIEDIPLSQLPLYSKIVKGKVIEKTGTKGRKKFPWLLVAGGVTVVIVLALLLKKKKEKEYTLTVTRGAGVDGEPANGTYSYKKGTSVHYNYTLQSGYSNFRVQLDNNQVSASGTITMDGNHTLTATATQNAVAFVTSTDSLSVGEGGSNSFTVNLFAQPTTTITANFSRVSGDSDISVTSGSSLTFKIDNWNIPQTVSLTAGEDDDSDNGTAIIRISSAGIPDKDVTVTEIDNDPINPGITFVTDKDTLTIPEGKTASFQVKLSGKPKKTITASVSQDKGDSGIIVTSGPNLTFTTSNWGTDKTVILQAAEDDDDTGSKTTILISATTAQSGIPDKNIEVTVNDNDKVIIEIKAPQAGDTLKKGQHYTIKWETKNGTLDKLYIKLSWGDLSGTGGESKYIVENTTNNGSFDWVPDIVNDKCQLTFEKSKGKKVQDGDSGVFKIIN